MSQFRLGRAKRGRQSFEPTQFGFLPHANRETGLWLQTLTWILDRSSLSLQSSETMERSDRMAVRRFLADYYRDPESTIFSAGKPLQLVLIGHSWHPGKSPRLKLPTSLGCVATTLQILSGEPKITRDCDRETTPLRAGQDQVERKPQQRIFYAAGVKL